jgi:TonB family protein
MYAAMLTSTLLMLGVVVPLGSAQPMRPTRIVSLHYPCLALKARVQGKIRVRCAVADNGSCFDAKIIYGHPLFYREVIENAKRWMFPSVEGGSRSRTVDIDYRFESRGIRASTVNADVDVTFELPNTVNVIAPFDANVPCQTPPLE